MGFFIGIEDLAANALIELVEKTGSRMVLLSQLNKYGHAIIAKLKSEDTDVTLIFTKDNTERFFHDCSDIFTIKEQAGDTQIILNEGISTKYLRNRFRINIALKLLRAFVAKDVINVILESTNETI